MIDADLEMFDFEHARPIRAAELDILTDFYDLINIAKEDDVLSGDTFVFTNIRNNGFLNVLESTLSSVNDSYVFHCKGSSKINQLTTFQGLFNHLLGDSEIGNSIYLGNKSPKDAHNASLYSSASEKVRYLVETSFPDDAHNSHGNRDAQKNEIHQLMQAVDELYSLKKSNGEIATSISDADLKNDENIETIRNALLIINDSQLLCDLVPNTIYKLFIDEPQFSVTSGSYSVDFACVDPFYHYYFNVDTLTQLTTPNFNAKYSLKDINGIRQLLIDYEAFDGELNGGDITNCDTLKLLTGTVDTENKFYSTGALSDLLYTLHNNPIFHTPARNYVGSDYYTNKYQTGYTLFEEMMSNICKFVGLHDFAYDSGFDSEASASVKLYNNIKAITLADDGKGTGICYHTANGLAWNQEIHSIMETAYRVADASSGATIDIDHFNLEDLSPESVKNVLTALNSSDLVGDAVPNFVKDGFEAINLGTLTTYETTNYANYHIGKVGYGGSDAKAENGTEIDNIYHVLTALRNGSAYVDNVSDISDFVANDSTGERLEGLLRYVYESRILNTPHGGEYRSYYTVSSYKITAQGILLYNAFNNSGLASFIARDALTTTSESTALEKIQQLSIIVHMPYEDSDAIAGGLTYTVESKGLTYLITETNNANIDGSSFSGAGQNDINNVKNNYREPILNIMNIAYNSDGSGHRSALVSELVAGLLNNVMENEYNSLYGKAGYAFNEFTFGKPASESSIKYKHYNSINLTEKNGLEGILNSLDYASQLNASTLMTMSDDQRHELANNLEACFALMTTGGQNSEIARIVYLNDFHQVLKPLAAVPNKDMQAFVSYLVNETSTSTEADSRTVYSSNFSFATYGTALKNYIYPGFY